jgi:hypothetical protein
MSNDDQKLSILEQHIGTILQIGVVALLAWSLMTTQTMSKDVEVLKVKLEAMSTSMQQGTNDRYRGTDAARDFAAVRQEIAFMERRLANLEAKLK